MVVNAGDRIDYISIAKLLSVLNRRENFTFNSMEIIAPRATLSEPIKSLVYDGDQKICFPISLETENNIINPPLAESVKVIAVILRDHFYAVDFFRDPVAVCSYINSSGNPALTVCTIEKNLRVPTTVYQIFNESNVGRDLDMEILVIQVPSFLFRDDDGKQNAIITITPDNVGSTAWDSSKPFSDVNIFRSNIDFYIKSSGEDIYSTPPDRGDVSNIVDIKQAIIRLQTNNTMGGTSIGAGWTTSYERSIATKLFANNDVYWIRCKPRPDNTYTGITSDAYAYPEGGEYAISEYGNYFEYAGKAYVAVRGQFHLFTHYINPLTGDKVSMFDEDISSYEQYNSSEAKVRKLVMLASAKIVDRSNEIPLDDDNVLISQDLLRKLEELANTPYYNNRVLRANTYLEKDSCEIAVSYGTSYGTGFPEVYTGANPYTYEVRKMAPLFLNLSDEDQEFLKNFFNLNDFVFFTTFRRIG